MTEPVGTDQVAPALPRLSDYLGWWAAAAPERTALVEGRHRISYPQLAHRVDGVARALLACGVGRGERVALLSHPRRELVEVMFAAASLGAVFQGLNPKHHPHELAAALHDTRPRLVLTTGDGTPPPGVPVTGLRTADGAAWLRAGAGIGAAGLAAARDAVRPGDPAVLVHTSGSSGRPKAALLPHRGLVRCGLVQGTHLVDPGVPPVIVNNLPVDHVGCLGDITASTLIAGGTVVLQDRFDPARLLAAIGEEGVTVWGGVPAMFALCVAHPAFATADLSSVRRVVSGGGPMPLAVARALTARVPTLINAYGLTETTGNVTFTAPGDDLGTVTGTVGRPDPRYDVQVVREDGSACSDGETGEIRVGGEFVMCGYLGLPAATAAAFDDRGRVRTGDLARRRADGALVLAGRLDERFKSGGHNVDPREIEHALERHPAVRLAAVVGVPDPRYGEVGHAYVVADPAVVTSDGLRTHAAALLANYKVPKRVEIRAELPLLPVGKVDRALLRAEAVAEAAS